MPFPRALSIRRFEFIYRRGTLQNATNWTYELIPVCLVCGTECTHLQARRWDSGRRHLHLVKPYRLRKPVEQPARPNGNPTTVYISSHANRWQIQVRLSPLCPHLWPGPAASVPMPRGERIFNSNILKPPISD
eukprot:1613300-Pyramimonas_sp.AAC.1